MKKLFVFLTGLLIAAGAYQAWARPVQSLSPEELYEKSEVVIIGVVTEVRETGKSSTIQLGSNPPHPVKIQRAELKVVEIVKGKSEKEIVLEYAPLDHEKVKMIINGPIRIWLEKGKAYLMYLKQKKREDVFVGVLEGSYDDGIAIKSLKLIPSKQTDTPDEK